MVKKTKGKMGWHGESKRHSEARMKGAMTQSKNSSGRFYTRKTPKRIQNRVVKKITPKNQWEDDTGFEAKWLNAFEKEHGKISNVIDGNPFGVSGGKILETEDGEEWTVFDSYEDAERTAVDYVESQLEEEPGMFNQDWLQTQIDTDALGETIGQEEYDYEYGEAESEWGDENPEKKKRIEELGKKRSQAFEDKTNIGWHSSKEGKEYLSLTGKRETFADERATERKERVEEDPLGWWDDATGEPIPKEWINSYLDVEEASKNAIGTDGVAHFLSSYDGKEVEENGKFMYRHN